MRWIAALALLTTGSCSPSGIGIGESVEGELTAEDQTAHAGAVIDAVPVRPAERAVVIVTAEAFEPFVIVAARDVPLGASSGSDGRGACVAVPASPRDDLLVYVSSAGGQGLGAYAVHVEPYSEAVVAAHDCHPAPSDATDDPTLTATSTSLVDAHRPSGVG